MEQDTEIMDKAVVEGHVLPEHAMFSRPATVREEEMESMAFKENLKVLLLMEKVASEPKPVCKSISKQ